MLSSATQGEAKRAGDVVGRRAVKPAAAIAPSARRLRTVPDPPDLTEVAWLALTTDGCEGNRPGEGKLDAPVSVGFRPMKHGDESPILGEQPHIRHAGVHVDLQRGCKAVGAGYRAVVHRDIRLAAP